MVLLGLISVLRPPFYTTLIYTATAFVSYIVCFIIFPVSEWSTRYIIGRCLEVGGVAIVATATLYETEVALRRSFATRLSLAAEEVALKLQERRTTTLLMNVLPTVLVVALRRHRVPLSRLSQETPSASALQSDIVGFTAFSSTRPAGLVVQMLNEMFRLFDGAAAAVGMEKIKTVGDAYVAVSGAPLTDVDHAVRAVMMGMRMLDAIPAVNLAVAAADARFADDIAARGGDVVQHEVAEIAVRVGVGSGALMTGIIGLVKLCFDCIGAALDRAECMEQTGRAGRVQACATTYSMAANSFLFDIEASSSGAPVYFALRAKQAALDVVAPAAVLRHCRTATAAALSSLRHLGVPPGAVAIDDYSVVRALRNATRRCSQVQVASINIVEAEQPRMEGAARDGPLAVIGPAGRAVGIGISEAARTHTIAAERQGLPAGLSCLRLQPVDAVVGDLLSAPSIELAFDSVGGAGEGDINSRCGALGGTDSGIPYSAQRHFQPCRHNRLGYSSGRRG